MQEKAALQLQLPAGAPVSASSTDNASPTSLTPSSTFSTSSQVSSESVTTLSSSSIIDDASLLVAKISTLRLLTTHVGGALALFLATTDATIVSTSLPTIASDLTATQSQYTWVGVAYMLTQTAFQPLYGRFSDIIGRKVLLFASIIIFAIGSLLCGAAQDITWLIAARALAGTGGGGIVSAVWTITAEIVPIERRAKWSQALSITWSCSAIAGPLLGGVFSSHQGSSPISWRWGFYMNLPICFVAFIVLYFSLDGVPLSRSTDSSWRTLAQRFDFGGLVLFMGGSSCIVVGFSFATEAGWTSPSTLILIILGLVVLVCGGFYEMHTSRDSLFPPSTFNDLTAVIILIVTFLHNFAFNAGTFYLALFYQAADGLLPFEAGIKMLPYSLGSSLASMPAAWFIGHRQSRVRDTSGQIITIVLGLVLSTIGFGLLIILNENSSVAQQTIYPLIAGIGLGLLFHAPYQVFLRALKPREVGTGTSAFFLVRFTGATIGLAVAGAVFYGRSSTRLPPNLPSQHSMGSIDYSQLTHLQPLELRQQVLQVVSSSIQTIWMVCSPCLGVALLISLLLRKAVIEDSPNSDPPRERSTSQEAESPSAEKV
ncbi:amino acid permease ScVBA-like protein [Pluteus cervinus]|uniref:Amino acid permease ScVBA-like protein n=1 Tax=Pluteus cervinus TaxID=181527 RepID=A0ACD3BGN2_9AGAR|nr:amino acid permease ScVBA-like protein [Pluteus cervinus]